MKTQFTYKGKHFLLLDVGSYLLYPNKKGGGEKNERKTQQKRENELIK